MSPEQIKILKEEVVRQSLLTYPAKFRFMHERGLETLDQVHEWMRETRTNFENFVKTLEEK